MAGRIAFFVTADWYFCSHRLPLAIAARDAGHEVHVITHVDRHAHVIREAGLQLHPVMLSRGGTQPVAEARAIAQVTALYRRIRPDLVHHVSVKPVLYGSIAATLAGVPSVVNAFTGLGYLFTSRQPRARLLRALVEPALRAFLNGRGRCVVMQNRDDLELLAMRRVVDGRHAVLIRGSGVDTRRFAATAQPEGVPLVVLPARLLGDKGVPEFVEAADQLRAEGVAARFALVGPVEDQNPSAVPEARVRDWVARGSVEWWGAREDMPEVFRQAAIVCLPSHREGLPKALLEAASSARAMVATDVPGCREIAREGITGRLVPARDPQALAAALRELIAAPATRARMGEAGAAIARAEFSVEAVCAQTLALYERLLSGRRTG